MQVIGPPPMARFAHENGTQLRLQAFVIVRDAERRIACLRVEGYEGWMLPGESMRLNEAPADAAKRIVDTWFTTPVTPKLADVQSYPATGPDDDRWYLLFIYEAQAPAGGLKGTPDTQEITFTPAGKAPGPFAMSHADVFARLAQ